tara:strand:- start:5621 stop:6184 length:564 start_codon:yes stop_codon:yes gene_type:complete
MIDFLYQKKTRRFQIVVEKIETLCLKRFSKSVFNQKTNREKEIEAKKNLIQLMHPKSNLIHDIYGAPKLSNGKAFSLSHSKKLLAVISANKLASIDIEPISQKAFRVRSKFLSNREQNLAKNNEMATLMWCAKECLYKIHKTGGINLKENLSIKNIFKNKLECYLLDKEYTLNYEKIKEHWLVYYFD